MKLICSVAPDLAIGVKNTLPWNIPDDMKHFRETTSGNTCIMGLNTFRSIGRPLPNRNNIVLSKDPVDIPGVDVVLSIPEAVEKAKSYGVDVFIIGGASIYAQFLPLADEMQLSWVKRSIPGDAFFPRWDDNEWEIVEEKEYPDFIFKRYKRKTG